MVEQEPIASDVGEHVVSEDVTEDVTEDTTSVPIEQVASDIREILTESDNKPKEVTRAEWLAVGPRRRPDGTWRKFPEMV